MIDDAISRGDTRRAKLMWDIHSRVTGSIVCSHKDIYLIVPRVMDEPPRLYSPFYVPIVSMPRISAPLPASLSISKSSSRPAFIIVKIS